MHGLETLIAINTGPRQRAETNARDPGHNELRRAEADLELALSRMLGAIESLPGASNTPVGDRFPPDFSITTNGDETWFLPLTVMALQQAGGIFPPGTRRFGMHYILEGDIGRATANSIRLADIAGD